MASSQAPPSGLGGRTPLDNMFSYIPSSHEKVVRQAFYNIAAGLFVGLLCATALATYSVFQPFITPLVWAVLLGTVLHPVKRRLTIATDRWLADQQRSAAAPLFVKVLVLPVSACDALVETLGTAALRHIRPLAAAGLSLALANLMYFYVPHLLMAPVWILSYGVVGNLLWLLASIFRNKLLCWTCVITYLLSVAFLWSPGTCRFAVPVWLLLLGFLSGLAGPLAGPIFIALVALLALGLVTEVRVRRQQLAVAGLNVTLSDTIRHVMCGRSSIMQQSVTVEVLDDSGARSDEADMSSTADEHDAEDDDRPANLPSTIAESPNVDLDTTPAQSHSIAASILQRKVMTSTPLTRARPRLLDSREPTVGSTTEEMSTGTVQAGTSATTASYSGPLPSPYDSQSQPVCLTTWYITMVMYACLVVVVWQRIWLLSMLPVLIVYYLLRRLVVNFWSSGGCELLANAMLPVNDWLRERQEGFMPLPICGVWKLILRGNASLIERVRGSVDSVVTVIVVVGGIVFVMFAAVFASVQIYGETVHMVELTASLINTTVVANPDLRSLFPGNMTQMVEQMLDDGYLYGRDYISQLMSGLVSDSSPSGGVQLERQTLELWDRLYQASVNSMVASPAIGPVVDSSSVVSAGQLWLQRVRGSFQLLNLDSLKEAVKSNLGTVLSVLDSFWSIVRGNMSSLLSVVTSLVSVLLGGGFAVLNSLLDLIVFLTSLFYLLSSSGRLYKPVEWIMKLGPVSRGSSRFVLAVDEAVSSVFVASFKMAVFYFLWTWLVHSVFAVNLVYLPSVIAAMLGAVPFLGSYWAALPAVLELWLVHNRPYTAVLFFLAQIGPILFVDSAIYSEVKGGHPYLTGLAIAGGIFCQGIEGAFFGPVLLCCLLVAVNMYTSVVNAPSDETDAKAARARYKRVGSIW